jgi:hypothetical protein
MFLINLLLFVPIAWYLYECRVFLADLARTDQRRDLRVSSPVGQEVLLRYIFGLNKGPREQRVAKMLVRLRILLAVNTVLLVLWFLMIFLSQ